MSKVYTKESLWKEQAPCWNFELDQDQLLAKALEVGFVIRVGKNKFVRQQLVVPISRGEV